MKRCCGTRNAIQLNKAANTRPADCPGGPAISKEDDFMQTAKKQPDSAITKKIGSTIYSVSIHFSKTSTEDLGDKIIRLIKNDPATWGPREAAGLCGERRSNGAERMPAARRAQRSEVCDDVKAAG
jgi:hypothetical protein